VTISRGFWMGKYEVTQAEYGDVVGGNPSYFRNGTTSPYGGSGGPVTSELRHPVESVSWSDATNYCGRLTERERSAGRLPLGYVYRLPTEAEWEYACRAGTTTPFPYGNELRSGMANFRGKYEYPPCGNDPYWCYNPSGIYLGRTTAAGSYAPNAWGLYDMHGNVWEWCLDWYGAYPGESVTDPQGPGTGSTRVFRGGSGFSPADYLRSASRNWDLADVQSMSVGFRAVLARPLP
jgi:formylglycine-generating enzyme required for sulfatase activity